MFVTTTFSADRSVILRRAAVTLLLLWLALTGNAFAGQTTLAWNPGSGPVAGYRVYYGTSSGHYSARVNAGLATSVKVANLVDGARYFFAVRAYDAAGRESASSQEVSLDTTLVANFSLSTAAGAAPFQTVLSERSTGNVVRWSWDFGDGSRSSAQNPAAHTYARPGRYAVTLTVFDALGQQASKQVFVQALQSGTSRLASALDGNASPAL